MHFKTKERPENSSGSTRKPEEPTPDYSGVRQTPPLSLTLSPPPLQSWRTQGHLAGWRWVAILPPDRAPVCTESMLLLGPRQQRLWFAAQVDGRRNRTNGQGAKRQQRVSHLQNTGGSAVELGFQRQSSLILQASLYIVVNVCASFLCGLSHLAKIVYNSRDKKASGQPHLSQLTVPNNWIKETNQNELMRCMTCLGLFLEPSLLSTVEAQALSARQPLELQGFPTPTVASAHSTFCFKGDQMAGLGRGPPKEKQGVQAKKINREKKRDKSSC